MEKNVRVWVWVMVINKEWKVLMGKRKWLLWEWKYWPPGWHQEFSESIEETVIRELKEESNLVAHINDVIYFGFTDDFMQQENKHYISMRFILKNFGGELKNMEPHKLEKWEWMSWEEIKLLWDKNFLPMQNFIKKYPDFDPTNI